MKKIILISLFLLSTVFADKIKIDVGSLVSHSEELKVLNLNEDNNLFGISYYSEFEDFDAGVFCFKFDNSYNKKTNVCGIVAEKEYEIIDDIYINANLYVGYQSGYCNTGFNTHPCQEGEKDESLAMGYTVGVRYEFVGLDFLYTSDVRIAKTYVMIKF